MSKTNPFSQNFLELVLQNLITAGTAFALLGSGFAATGTAGSTHLSLHTADPGEAGSSQTASEIAYTGYSRLSIARTSSSSPWSISGKVASNTGVLAFGQRTNSGATVNATHWGLGTASSGTGYLLYKGPLAVADPFLFVVDDSAVGDTLICPSHNFAVDDQVVVIKFATDSLPTELTDGTVYWIKTQVDDQITLAATQGGTQIALTNGAGMIARCVPQPITEGSTPSIAIGQLVITDD